MNDFAERVAAQRPILLRTAHQMLRNKAWAEDAVSETLVAALEKPGAFAAGAGLRTWLVAILKHKIVDQIRHHTRECQVYVMLHRANRRLRASFQRAGHGFR